MRTSLSTIPDLAKKTAAALKGGEVLALIGNLGSGKTTFTKALARELKIKQNVTSPTFIIMNLYPFKLRGKKAKLYHLDLYRLNNFKDVAALGIKDIWHEKDSVTVIEWADKITKHLPKSTKKIYFDHEKVVS